jgi:cell wall-associated NlpC family hydrolase
MTQRRALAIVVALAMGLAAGACGAGKAPASPQPFPRPGAAPPAAPRPVPAPAGTPASAATTLGEQVLESARAQLGVPYHFGGSAPATGFDCSGLIQYVFETHHMDLPRTVGEQYGRGIKVAIQDVRAGDLVFFSTTGPGPTHVGIAVGNGQFIHAPTSNGVVRIEHYDLPYWHDRLIGARRMF